MEHKPKTNEDLQDEVFYEGLSTIPFVHSAQLIARIVVDLVNLVTPEQLKRFKITHEDSD